MHPLVHSTALLALTSPVVNQGEDPRTGKLSDLLLNLESIIRIASKISAMPATLGVCEPWAHLSRQGECPGFTH